MHRQGEVFKMSKKPKAFILLAAVLTVALLGLLFIRNQIDFPVYYRAGQSLLAGRVDLYAPDFALGQVMDYRYPPFFLIVFLPLWLPPYSTAAYLWYLLSALALAGIVILLRAEIAPARLTKLLLAACILALAQYFVMALHYGNAHLLAICFLFAAFYFENRDRSWHSALLLSISITIKLTPIILLPYLAIKRRWKMLSACALFVVLLNLAPGLYFGFQENSRLLRTWYKHVIANQEFHEVNGPINLSMKGILRRYFTEVDYNQRVDGDVEYRSVNLTTLSSDHTDATWMMVSAALLIAALAFITWRTRKSEVESKLPALELGLMVCLMLLIGPLSSKIYFIALIWPVVSLAGFASVNRSSAATFARRVIYSVAFVNSVLPLLPGRSTQRLLLVLGVDSLVTCLLTLALVFAIYRSQRSPRASYDEAQIQSLPAARTS
jgi:hypothetical protein